MHIVSTTDLQRNIKKVLEKVNSSAEPVLLVRDSIPAAVMIPYDEYKRISTIEKEALRKQMLTILEKRAKLDLDYSDDEIDRDIEEARNATRGY